MNISIKQFLQNYYLRQPNIVRFRKAFNVKHSSFSNNSMWFGPGQYVDVFGPVNYYDLNGKHIGINITVGENNGA